MNLLSSDNEQNALQCLPIIFELHKNFRAQLEGSVQHFLSFFTNLYVHLQRTVSASFQTRVSLITLSTLAVVDLVLERDSNNASTDSVSHDQVETVVSSPLRMSDVGDVAV